ncbi:MAG: family 20 glycosylhydrolase [Planctomycetota bacterium]
MSFVADPRRPVRTDVTLHSGELAMVQVPETPLIVPAPQRMRTGGPSAGPPRDIPTTQTIDPATAKHPQGYRLAVEADTVTLVGHDEAGLFYGRQTLELIRRQCPDRLPRLTIDDWPDLAVRGYMLDVSRDRVPTMATLRDLIDRLALLKFNQLQLYTEHTLAYAGHEAVWRDASPITFDELAGIEAYCAERFVELVPCQNLFGHMHRWLTKPGYADLAETPDGWDTPWGYRENKPHSLNPGDPRSFALSADLIDQLAPRLRSGLFNIGCDETNDLGQGRSRALVAKVGRAEVYLAYLTKLCGRVTAHRKTPMFWGDIVLDHPELVPRLPEDAVLLNWNYEGSKSFGPESEKFRGAGVRFYVCPGTSSWCSLGGRGRNAVDNLRDAAAAGVTHGAEGVLITDWGDHGHWQPFATSWVGLIYGAGVAWALEANRSEEPISAAIGLIAGNETDGELGDVLWDLSNVYLGAGPKFSNQTFWFHHLRKPSSSFADEPWNVLTPDDVDGVLERLDAVSGRIESYRPGHPEAARLADEAAWCAAVSRWACRRVGRLVERRDVLDTPDDLAEFAALVERFRTAWTKRYRPGGLADSVEKLTAVLRTA